MWRIRLGSGKDGTRPAAPVPRTAKVIGTIAFGMFFVIGLLFLVEVARETWQTLETRGWREQAMTIVLSEVETRKGENPYVPVVAFRYVWNGEELTGRQIATGDVAEDTYADAHARIAPYPVGAVVTGRVARDGRAVLEHGSPWFALLMLFPMVFVAIGAAGLWATWKPTRRDAMGRPVEPAISSTASKKGGAAALLGVGGIFAALGAGLAWPMAIGPGFSVWRAQEWVPTDCVVEQSSVRSHRSDDGTTYSVDILYRWERGGHTERSNRYSFFGGSSSGREAKADVVRAHPAGHAFTCWVDPTTSGEAVIERGLTAHAWLGLLPLAFIAAGLLSIRAGLRQREQRARLADALGQAGRGPAPDDPVLTWIPEFDPMPGPTVLSPEWSRRGRLFGVVFGCVFWNGIVAVFASEAHASFVKGRPEWGLTLFLVPFVLVGAGLCLAIVYEVLRATNARAELEVTTSSPMLGETVEVAWRLRGRLSSVRRLTIALEGRESATYRRGTNSYTATEVFVTLPLVDLVDPHRMAAGRTAVTLPRDSHHSFEGGNNTIDWALRLEGEIDRWPDIDERFPIVVLPLPHGERVKPEDPV